MSFCSARRNSCIVMIRPKNVDWESIVYCASRQVHQLDVGRAALLIMVQYHELLLIQSGIGAVFKRTLDITGLRYPNSTSTFKTLANLFHSSLRFSISSNSRCWQERIVAPSYPMKKRFMSIFAFFLDLQQDIQTQKSSGMKSRS
jgi:hypothetical protein